MTRVEGVSFYGEAIDHGSYLNRSYDLERLARAVHEWAVVDDDVAVLGWGADYGGRLIDDVWEERKREMISLARQFL